MTFPVVTEKGFMHSGQSRSEEDIASGMEYSVTRLEVLQDFTA